MHIHKSALGGLGLLTLALSLPATASANIVLTFDQSNYTINAVGGTADVKVFVQQTLPLAMNEPTVDAGNGLTAASIKLTINDATIANVLTTPTGGPAWDASSGGFDGSGNPNLANLSIAGLDITGSPVLLGDFIFTGLKAGSTMTFSALLDKNSFNFTDVNGDNLDPFVAGSSATITVLGANAIPEPSTIVSGGLAVLIGGVAWRRRARKARAA